MLNNDFDILLFYGNNRILYIHHRYNQQIILEKEILYGIRKKKNIGKESPEHKFSNSQVEIKNLTPSEIIDESNESNENND